MINLQYLIFLLIGAFGVWFSITNEGTFPIELRWFFGLAGLTLIVASLGKIIEHFNEEHYS